MSVLTEEPTDEHLIKEILAGNDGAFVRLVRRHKPRVFGLAARFARDTDELDDICQNVFIKVFENLATYRHEAPFEHWLARITVRACHDALRRRKREKYHLSLDAVHHQIADGASSARQAAEEARDLLERGLSRLRPEERLVITLLELEEKSIREVAALTGWSEANVKVRAFRARQKLKGLLEKQYER